MTDVLSAEPEVVGTGRERSSARPAPAASPRLVAGVAALAAALVHASVIAPHSDHTVLSRLFLASAIGGAALGIALLVSARPAVLGLGAAVHAGFVAVWVLSRTTGISFVDGLEEVEAVGWADGLAALFGAVVVVGAVLALRRPSERRSRVWVPASVVVLALSVPAMVNGTAHSGGSAQGSGTGGGAAQSHGSTAAEGHSAGTPEGKATEHPVAKPFDPSKPIDLSGTPGVTQTQQKEAELLLAKTLEQLPRFADPAVAEAAGYRSIGDALTGDEHLMNWNLIDDNVYLDPSQPESLVYSTRNGGRELEAAMFILPSGFTLDNAPRIGGDLIQWHIHDNLCFTPWPDLKVAMVTSSGGPCPDGLTFFPPHVMIHVWIKPNSCGPFASLKGVGAGQVRKGETRACDRAHGSTGAF